MKIISLQAQNVKRLRAIEITPDGNMVVIGGKNNAGKSSVMDSISMALGGKDAIPQVPVRRGEDKARVKIDLGDLIVTRTFTAEGGTALVVTNKDGLKFPSPQAILDGLATKLGFDPLEFARQKPQQQSETLRGLVGLDFTVKNQERQKAFDERTMVNREVRTLESRLSALPMPKAGVPAQEEMSASILEKQRVASEINARNAATRQAAAFAKAEVTRTISAATAHADRITEAEATINRLQESLAEIKRQYVFLENKQTDAETKAKELLANADVLKDVDLAPFAADLQALEGRNKLVREQAQRNQLNEQLKEKGKQADALSKSIEDVDTFKRQAIAKTAFPIDGLSVDDAGEVIFSGLPLSQASSAEQTRISVAIGFALNPKLRVLLIRDGSLLDEDSLKLVAEMAEKNDGQVWIERVATDGTVSLIIEDGMVKQVESPVTETEPSLI